MERLFEIWKWIFENKEWLFSGIGVAFFLVIIKLLRGKKNSETSNGTNGINHGARNDISNIKDGNKSVKVKESTAGVIGDNPVIHGGIHFHNDEKKKEHADP